ncbi:MAG: hypothetical protein JO079_07195, partial [Frankiaceae bacterium]|nr:hypothetical protein [Frankiaceae bacterium]
SKNEHYFGQIKVTSLIPAMDGRTAADVLVHYDYLPSGVADAHGRVIRSSQGRTGIGVDFRLLRINARWLIDQILTVSSGRSQ